MTTEEAVACLERLSDLTNDAGKGEVRALITAIRAGLTKPEKAPEPVVVEETAPKAARKVKPQ